MVASSRPATTKASPARSGPHSTPPVRTATAPSAAAPTSVSSWTRRSQSDHRLSLPRPPLDGEDGASERKHALRRLGVEGRLPAADLQQVGVASEDLRRLRAGVRQPLLQIGQLQSLVVEVALPARAREA